MSRKIVTNRIAAGLQKVRSSASGSRGRRILAAGLLASAGCLASADEPSAAEGSEWSLWPFGSDGKCGDIKKDSPFAFNLPLDQNAGEHLVKCEQAALQSAGESLQSIVTKAYGSGRTRALRDVHAISHGCVHAQVSVPHLPDDLRQGIFANEANYDALIRFSNGDGVGSGGPPGDDNKSQMRGMAIKVLGVGGEKLLESEKDATTQDFLMVNRSEFFLPDIVSYAAAMRAVKDGPMAIAKLFLQNPKAATQLLGGSLSMKFDKNFIDSPLNTDYFSKLPYRFGSLIVKYRTSPCSPTPVKIPKNPAPHYLREMMKAQLDPTSHPSSEGACFRFEVQRHQGEDLENATKAWHAPFEEVARITIPNQDFDTNDQNEACENLSFTPWHALPAHRPLGSLNRGRKVVYEVMSKFRHDQNGVPRREP